MTQATLTISSRNYSSWSLRGWLICRLSGLDFAVETLSLDDPEGRAELLHLSPSFLVPRLVHGDVKVWGVLAIAQYLMEIRPRHAMLPKDLPNRAWCRSISGEMHSGFMNLRTALPMNLKAHHPGFKVWAGAQGDIARVLTIFKECLDASGGPWLFGDKPTLADVMFAPVCTRFATYDVALPAFARSYRDHVMAWPLLREWIEAALAEPDEIEELGMEF